MLHTRFFLSLALVGCVVSLFILITPQARAAMTGVDITSKEFLDDKEGWAAIGGLPIFEKKIGEENYFRFGFSARTSGAFGFTVEMTQGPSLTAWGVVKNVAQGDSLREIAMPAFKQPGPKHLILTGESVTLPNPSAGEVGSFILEQVVNVYNSPSIPGGALPQLLPTNTLGTQIAVEGLHADMKSYVNVIRNGVPIAALRPGQVLNIDVKITDTLSVEAVVPDGSDEEFKGWSDIQLPAGSTCLSTATQCQIFTATSKDTVLPVSITGTFAKKITYSKLTLAKAGTGKIYLKVTDPDTSVATVICADCALKEYTYPQNSIVDLVAIDADKTGTWSSTGSFCVPKESDPTQCKGILSGEAHTATATFGACDPDAGGASLLSDTAPSQCASVTLTKTSSEGATGTVTETTATRALGLTCGAGCTTKTAGGIPDGRQITLVAAPNTGYFFSGWTGISNCGSNYTCTFQFDGAKQITAKFSGVSVTPADRHTVSFSRSGSGAALGSVVATLSSGNTLSSGTAVNTGTVVTFSATISPGSGKFISWGGACSGNVPTCTVTVNSQTSVTARFEKYLTVDVVKYPQTSSYGKPNGSVKIEYSDALTPPATKTCGSSCETVPIKVLAVNPKVTVTVIPDAASKIAKWANACASVAATSKVCTLTNFTGNQIARVELAIPTYTVTVNVRGNVIGTDMMVVGALTDGVHSGAHTRSKQCSTSSLVPCYGWTWSDVHRGQGLTLVANGASYGAAVTYQGCGSSTASGACGAVEGDRTITVQVTGGEGGLLVAEGPRHLLAQYYSRVRSFVTDVSEPITALAASVLTGARGVLAAVTTSYGPDLIPYGMVVTPSGAAVGMPITFHTGVANIGNAQFSIAVSQPGTITVQRNAAGSWVDVFSAASNGGVLPRAVNEVEFLRWSAKWTPTAAGEYRIRYCVRPNAVERSTTNNCAAYRYLTVPATYAPATPPKHTVTVKQTGGGAITSTSNSSDTNFAGCGSTCSRTFRAGTTLTLTAAPGVDRTFARWEGLSAAQCVVPAGSPNKCELTVDGYKGIIAVFEPILTGDTLTLCGDADRSGKVTSTDANLVNKYAVGNAVNINTRNADANGDNKITVTDASLILKAAVGSAKLEVVNGVCKATLL